MGVSLLKSAPGLTAGWRTPFLPVVTPPGDVRALSEFIVVSIEAERRDYLKTIRFEMNLETPQLWAAP